MASIAAWPKKRMRRSPSLERLKAALELNLTAAARLLLGDASLVLGRGPMGIKLKAVRQRLEDAHRRGALRLTRKGSGKRVLREDLNAWVRLVLAGLKTRRILKVSARRPQIRSPHFSCAYRSFEFDRRVSHAIV